MNSENNKIKKRIISKGWSRLHIILSIIISVLLPPFIVFSYVFSTDVYDYRGFSLEKSGNRNIWYFASLVLFLFYWICLLFLWVLFKYGKNFISKNSVFLYILFLPLFSIIITNIYVELYFFHQILFFLGYILFYLICLIIYIWIASGFKDSKTID